MQRFRRSNPPVPPIGYWLFDLTTEKALYVRKFSGLSMEKKRVGNHPASGRRQGFGPVRRRNEFRPAKWVESGRCWMPHFGSRPLLLSVNAVTTLVFYALYLTLAPRSHRLEITFCSMPSLPVSSRPTVFFGLMSLRFHVVCDRPTLICVKFFRLPQPATDFFGRALPASSARQTKGSPGKL